MILEWSLWSPEVCHQVQLYGTSASKVKGSKAMLPVNAPGFARLQKLLVLSLLCFLKNKKATTKQTNSSVLCTRLLVFVCKNHLVINSSPI